MMPKRIVHVDSVGDLVALLSQKFANGEIAGLVVGVLNRDGETFEIGWTRGMSYLERLGLAEAIKGDCIYEALCPYCE